MKKGIFLAALAASLTTGFTTCSNANNNTATEPLATDETYTCPMHPEVMSDHTGTCPKCKMDLEKQKMTAEQKKMKESGNYVKPSA